MRGRSRRDDEGSATRVKVALAGMTGTGGTIAAIAREAGVSYSRAAAVLAEGDGFSSRRDADGRLVYDLEALDPARSNATGKSRRRGEPFGPPSRRERTEAAVDRVRQVLRTGDFAALRRVLSSPELDLGSLRRCVGAHHRDALEATVRQVLADAAMQRGEPSLAIRLASRARALSNVPMQRSQLAAVESAALRMVGLAGCTSAVGLTLAAIEDAGELPGEERSARLRHLHNAEVAPRLAIGDLRGAGLAAERSLGLCADAAEHAESLLGRARVAIAEGRFGRAEGDVERASELSGEIAWLGGWAVRIRAALLAERGEYGAAQSEMAVAFGTLRGHGFQENLLLARLASLPVGAFESDRFTPGLLRHIGRLVADRHRRLGVRPSECAVCCRWDIRGRAAHALGFEVGPIPRFWST